MKLEWTQHETGKNGRVRVWGEDVSSDSFAVLTQDELRQVELAAALLNALRIPGCTIRVEEFID